MDFKKICNSIKIENDRFLSQNIENTEPFKRFRAKLQENVCCKPILDYAEERLNIDRVYLVAGVIIIFIVSLMFQYGISLLCLSIGTIYPGYKTLQILEVPNVQVTRQLLIYWFTYATLNFLEIFTFFLSWIPLYWLAKCCFLIWCFAPTEYNGSEIIYDHFIQPIFHKNLDAINNAFNQVAKTAHSIYTNAEPVVEGNEQTHVHQN